VRERPVKGERQKSPLIMASKWTTLGRHWGARAERGGQRSRQGRGPVIGEILRFGEDLGEGPAGR